MPSDGVIGLFELILAAWKERFLIAHTNCVNLSLAVCNKSFGSSDSSYLSVRMAFSSCAVVTRASWRKYAQESLKETERDPAMMAAARNRDFPPWVFTLGNI